MRDDWLKTYREFSDPELEAEIARLDKHRQNFMTQQSAGSKSFSRDLSAINDQYTAAIEVRGERRRAASGGRNPYVGGTDFSRVRID